METAKIIDYKGVEVLRKELVVLKNVDFSVTTGEMVYLMGRIGSGKSSLLKSFYAEVPLLSGDRAMVFDTDMLHIKRREVPMLRRRIGIVFQDFQLLMDRTVYDNLLFVMKATGWKKREDIDARINEVLSDAGMAKKSYKMPHELSGGEQQRIVIARAMLNSPRLILADEPTGNLDPESSEIIVTRLREIAANGTAVVMATHNDRLVEKYPARTVICRDKKLIES